MAFVPFLFIYLFIFSDGMERCPTPFVYCVFIFCFLIFAYKNVKGCTAHDVDGGQSMEGCHADACCFILFFPFFLWEKEKIKYFF
jgi:hypothetical protein